jgi:uncharacterized protein YbaP (TraB family)
LQALGFAPQYAIDRHFRDEAAAAKKPVAGLETIGFQVDLLSGLPDDLQKTCRPGSTIWRRAGLATAAREQAFADSAELVEEIDMSGANLALLQQQVLYGTFLGCRFGIPEL